MNWQARRQNVRCVWQNWLNNLNTNELRTETSWTS